MKISVDSVVSCWSMTIEVNGVLQDNVTELDTETGEATIFKKMNGKFVPEDGKLVTEKVTFPVEGLHVYLVKPK